MLRKNLIFTFITCLFLSVAQPVLAGFIYQNFEPESGDPVVTTIGRVIVNQVDRTEGVHLGIGAIKYTSPDYWTGFGLESQQGSVVNLKQTNNDRLTFWTLAFPFRNCYVYGCDKGTENTVSVRLFDQGNYQNGFEVWTTNTAKYDQWTKLWVLFSQLPPDFDLTHVTKIEFRNYWPGKYYFDDIHAVREDRVYQSFEKENRSGSTDSDYGWKWNDADTVGTSAPGEPVYEGTHSWKLVAQGNWSGTGIQSQEKRFHDLGNGNSEQSFWNVDLNPDVNDRLTLWVYALPQNGLANNLAVQFYDHANHSTDETKAVVWTKEAVQAGEWTRLTVLFKDLPADLNLHDLNKIQIQHYWPGTFYVDNIKATAPYPVINESLLAQGIVQWNPIPGGAKYRLQEYTEPNGWRTIYSGTQPSFTMTHLSKSRLRVRWEEDFVTTTTLPYASDWSNVVEFASPVVTFNYKSLKNGLLQWNDVPLATAYEIERSASSNGPWTNIYRGALKPISVTVGQWYRIRAIQKGKGSALDATGWSRPQRYHPAGQGYVKAAGTMLKDLDGSGSELILKGVNLGNYLLIEDWMTGIGNNDTPGIPDDWSVRDVLTTRFGANKTEKLLKDFQNTYFNDFDFNKILNLGFNVVRLPIFYRNLQDDQGNWILDANGNIDFSQIDRVVDALSDRGIYTIIDLHGAPGSQSAEFHTGRKNFNKLFNQTTEGELYRQRTVKLWRELARHYKDNTWVVGYDLLNEPVGAPTPQILWSFYNRLYKAIREIDANHLIMMEGIWDWNTLPNPSTMNWTNVLYQFHFYYWDHDSDFNAHKAFIDGQIAQAQAKQAQYNVPVMIGEFHGYSLKSIWQYYLQNFNTQKWSWVLWSYKTQPSPSDWALFNQARYDQALPKLRTDTYAKLKQKFSKYTTADYHVENTTLIRLLKDYQNTESAIIAPTVSSEPLTISRTLATETLPSAFTINGTNFGDTPGTVSFYWAPCNDYPPGSIACNYGQAGITFWSDTMIRGYVPPDALDTTRYNIQSTYGCELYPTMIGANHAPILIPIGSKSVTETQTLQFKISAVDPDGDALTYQAVNLPQGSTFVGQTFKWTPTTIQAGIYNVKFRVSDGQLSDKENVVINVFNQ